MKYKTLGDVVNEALIEHSPPKSRKEKILNSLEHFVAKHRAEAALGTGIAVGALGYLGFGAAGDYASSAFIAGSSFAISMAVMNAAMGRVDKIPKTMQKIKEGYEGKLHQVGDFGRKHGPPLGMMAGISVSLLASPWIAGKGIYRKIRGTRTEKKIGKIFRYPKTMALGVSAAIHSKSLLELPENIVRIAHIHQSIGDDALVKSFYKVMVGAEVFEAYVFMATFAFASGIGYILRDIEHMGSKGWKTMLETVAYLPLRIIGSVDQEKQIALLKRKVENTGSRAAKNELLKAYMKKSRYDGIDYLSQLLEEQEKKDESLRLTGLKKWMLGIGYISLFSKKDKWVHFFSFMDEIIKINPEAAKSIISHVRKRTPYSEVDAHLLMARISDKYFNEPQAEHYKKIADAITTLANKGEKVKRFRSSEGTVEEVPFSTLTRRKLIKKEYAFDFFERFLSQAYENAVLKNSGIGAEAPLAFEDKQGQSWMLVTREGKENLREELLNDKSQEHARNAFKQAVMQGLMAQKLLYSNLREKEGCFYADVAFDGKDYQVRIKALDLESHFLSRAFVGDEKIGERWGANDFLDRLVEKVRAFREENYYPTITTLNHGDYFTTNLILRKDESYSRIDPRHIIADALYDMTYLSLDPVFLKLSKDEKAEMVFNAMKEVFSFRDEKRFLKSFDYFYGVHNSLGLAASQQAHGMPENASMILNEAIEFIKDKPFMNDFLEYMKNSKGEELLKAI